MQFRLSLFIFPLFFGLGLKAQTKTSLISGNWNNPLIWTPLGVPGSADDVLINNGHTITFTNNAACNSLTVGAGSGGTAIFQYSGNIARTLSVQSTFLVNTNGSVLILNTSNTTHSLQLNGNLINNGSFDMNRDGNSRCVVVFVRNGNQTISGTGAAGDFYNIVLNMGTSNANVLEVSSNVFTVPTNFLTLLNGTFKVSTPNAVSIQPFTGITTIPASAGLWVNSTTALVSTGNDVTFAGLIRVSNGTLTIGNANTEDLIANNGTLTISGGRLNIAGLLNASAAAINFSMTGGSMLLPNVQSGNTTVAPFHLSFAGSQFNMSGGIIILNREGGTGAQNLGFVNTGSSSGSVSGGTLQFGSASTIANQQLRLISTFPVPNIELNSANITASVTTNTLQVNGNVNLISGTLTDNNLSIGVSGNWTHTGGTYANTNGTVIFNAAVGTQTIFRTGGVTLNNLQFTGAGLKSFASAVIAKGFTVNNGASVDVSTSSHQLSLSGNFINNGSFNSRNGTVLLNGTVAQNIGGSSISNFYNLSLTNAAGASLTAAENLLNTLSLSSGTFNTNGQNFTMVSTSTNTARVGQITGSGNIIGNVIVQRFAPGGTTGWAFLGTPISSALTLQDWDDDIFISCPGCPDGSAGGFLSIYTYSEAAAGLVDAPASYIPLSGITDPITFGKGYWVYFGNGQFTTSDITLDVTGSLRTLNQTIPLSYNNYGSAVDDGWNLIHNPYPAPISWTSLRGVTANIDNAIYVYNADLNAGLGGYATFVNGVSLPALGSGGIGDEIPMGQGFYVHSTGATALNATELNKVNSNPVFLKTTAQSSPNSNPAAMLRLQLKHNGLRDECLVYLQTNATQGFDQAYDAYKLAGTDPSAPSIALLNDTMLFAINGIPPVSGTYSTLLKVSTGTSGNYSISASDFQDFPIGACLKLYDTYSNSTHDLRNGDYAVWLFDTTSTARFILSIELTALSVSAGVTAPSCNSASGGLIVAQGNSQGPWNYTWKDTNGQVLQNHSGQTAADSLKNLNGGVYYLEMNTIGACDTYTNSFALPSVQISQASFMCVDSVDLDSNPQIHFSNLSLNNATNFWDFGDGNTNNLLSPLHSYTLPGSYQVNLITESSTACKDSVHKQILVYSKLTTTKELKNENDLVIYTLGQKEFKLILPENLKGQITLELIDGLGKVHWRQQSTISSSRKEHLLQLESLSEGVYYVKLTTETFQRIQKLLVY